MSRFKALAGLFLVATAVWGGATRAGDAPAAVPACNNVTDINSKSRLYLKGETLMAHLLILQGRGEEKFHLAYATPTGECVFESLDLAGAPLEIHYVPLQKSADNTLQWRFLTRGAEPREILVLYDGTTSVFAGKEIFLVAEERQGSIAFYAMFRDPPSNAALKPLVAGILDGSAKPLAKVRWPAGDKEPVIDAYDSQRLK